MAARDSGELDFLESIRTSAVEEVHQIVFEASNILLQPLAVYINRLVDVDNKQRKNHGKHSKARVGEARLERLLRNTIVCTSCFRRKRIGLVFCWSCWDNGWADKSYPRSPFRFSGLSVSSWLGIFSEHTIEEEAKGRSRDIKNMHTPGEEDENPQYNPPTAPATVMLTTEKQSKPIRPQVQFIHSNICNPGQHAPAKMHDYRVQQMDLKPKLSFTQALHVHSQPMQLYHSEQKKSYTRTLQRMWTILVPMISRISFLKDHAPTIIRNEYLINRALMKMKLATEAKVFATLLAFCNYQKHQREAALGANRMAMRLKRKAEMMCLESWKQFTRKQLKVKRFMKRTLGTILHYCMDIWKHLWEERKKDKEREAKGRAFIRRYQMQACVKCLYTLKLNADLQIRLRAFVMKWKMAPAFKMIAPWQDIVHRNKRVRAFIRRQLSGLKEYCFELWDEWTQETIATRKKRLNGVLYRMKRKEISAAFNTMVFFRLVSVATRNLQRAYRGFRGRVKAKKQRVVEEMVETERVKAEAEYMENQTQLVDRLFEHWSRKDKWNLFKTARNKIMFKLKLERVDNFHSVDAAKMATARFEETFKLFDYANTGTLLEEIWLAPFVHHLTGVPPATNLPYFRKLLMKAILIRLNGEEASAEVREREIILNKTKKELKTKHTIPHEIVGVMERLIQAVIDSNREERLKKRLDQKYTEEEVNIFFKNYPKIFAKDFLALPRELDLDTKGIHADHEDEKKELEKQNRKRAARMKTALKPSFIKRMKNKIFFDYCNDPLFILMEWVVQEYVKRKIKIVAREKFRYSHTVKAREICPNCRDGFRFTSELRAHKNNSEKCAQFEPPSAWTGNIVFDECVRLCEEDPLFPRLDIELASFPQFRTMKRAVGPPLDYMQYFSGAKSCEDMPSMQQLRTNDIVRVSKGNNELAEKKTAYDHAFWKRYVLKITGKEIVKIRTRNGAKKKIKKKYMNIAFSTKEEYMKWELLLQRIARVNRRRRRARREARIMRREKLRIEVREMREAKKKARKEMLADAILETRKKHRAERKRLHALRAEARKRQRKKQEEEGFKAIEEHLAMQKALELEHLVDQAEEFLGELKEAKAAVSKAQYGMFSESETEESANGEEEWGNIADFPTSSSSSSSEEEFPQEDETKAGESKLKMRRASRRAVMPEGRD